MADQKSPLPSSADAPRATTGTITFPCPNGHRISVPAKLAGKRGACSKCGTAVVIPPASVAITAPASPPAGRPAQAPGDAFVAGGDPQSGEEGTITLKSPPKSPPAWPAALSVPPATGLTEALVAAPVAATSVAPVGAGLGPAGRPPGAGGVEPGGLGRDAATANGSALVDNSTALLVARLWAERDHGGIVELHLVGGSVILPEWYEPAWSQGSHGLFASQAADGSVTLTAVAWDSIQKVVVRQVEGLPDGMFE